MSYDMAFKGTLSFRDKKTAKRALALLGRDEDCFLRIDDVKVSGKQLSIELFGSAPASMWDPTCGVVRVMAELAIGGHCNAQYDGGDGDEAIYRLRYHAGGEEEEIDGAFDDDMTPTPSAPAEEDPEMELHMAAIHDDEAAVRALLARGARSRRAMSRSPAIVQLLLDHGLDARGDDQHSPLCTAARSGTDNVEVVRLLLARGARTDESDTPSRATPLMLAAQMQKRATVDVLLAHGADVNARDHRGNTPLMHAVRYGGEGRQPVIEALLRAGADAELKNDRGQRFAELV